MKNLCIIKDYGLDLYKKDWDIIESLYDKLSTQGYNSLHEQLNRELENAKKLVTQSRQMCLHTIE